MTKELKIIVNGITNLKTRTEATIRNEEKVIITKVSFECETPAGKFDDVQQALKGNQPVDMMLACPQLAMEMGEKE